MRAAVLCLSNALTLLTQVSSAVGADVPTLTRFVAPPYPRSAKDQRISGKTLTRLSINRDGFVTEAKMITANRVFKDYVLEALKQWRFKPSDHEYTVEVTCLFEFTEGKCDGADGYPITSETNVSAELPAVVHIRTTLRCGFDR